MVIGPTWLKDLLPSEVDFLIALYWPVVTVLAVASISTLFHISTPRRSPWLRDVPGAVRSIAYGRLIALDVILVVGTVAGLVLLIVPGILFYTYLVISPTLVELNGVTARQALRQSFQLVRGNFWRVLGFGVVVLILSSAVTSILEAPFHGLHGEVLFNLLSDRYERRSVVVTTNLAFAEWVKVFGGDEKLTTALLDRLAHHATVITTKGKSYRMRKRIGEAASDEAQVAKPARKA